MKRNSLKAALGWTVSLVFLFLIFRNLDWQSFFESIKKVSFLELLILMGIYLLGFGLRGLRTKILLPGPSYAISLAGVIIGYAANNLLPARLGEVVRAQVIGKKANIKRTTVFSSIIAERIFDGLAVVTFVVIGSLGLKLPNWAEEVKYIGILVFSVALLGVLCVAKFKNLWMELSAKFPARELSHGLIEGLALAGRDFGTVLSVLVSSVLIWFIEGLMFYYGFAVFGIAFGLYPALFVLGVVNLGVLIPSSPGNTGVFQFFTVKALSVFAVAEELATAYSIVLHLCQLIPVTAIGLFLINRLGMGSALHKS